MPRPGAAGHLALNHAIITWLQGQGHQVRLLLTGDRLEAIMQHYGAAPVSGPHVRQVAGRVFAASPGALLGQAARAVLRRLPGPFTQKLRRHHHKADMVLGAFPSPEDLRWCARMVAKWQPEAVLIDTMFRAPLLAEPELAGCRSIVIAHDVFHRRAMAMEAAGYSVQPRALTRAREAELLSRAHAIAAIQPEEAAVLRGLCPGANVFAAPMPALPCPPPPYARRIPGRLVFVGSSSLPNLDALRWFLADIWPRLEKDGITLDILGDCGSVMRHLPAGVHARGRVADLAPYLHRAALAIAPLRTGSGLKLKLLDYARHGLTTIATPPALAGFEADGHAPFIAAGSAAMFAEAVRRHAHTPPEPEAALAYCRTHYGEAACFAGLAAALHGGRGEPARPHLGVLGR